jgi:hypothetical protein
MNLILIRNVYTDKSTIVDLLVDNEYFCHALEDVVRKPGEKIFGKTAIPTGKYEVVLSMSNRFKKLLPELLNVPGFAGVRIHGGNTSDDTDGCIVVAKNIINNDLVQGNCTQQLIDLLQSKKERHFINILNSF